MHAEHQTTAQPPQRINTYQSFFAPVMNANLPDT